MLETIAETLRAYKDNPDLAVTPEMTFAELELDSLDTVELVMELEEKLGISIELEPGIATIAQLIEQLQQAQSQA